jgi:hypothetical protein
VLAIVCLGGRAEIKNGRSGRPVLCAALSLRSTLANQHLWKTDQLSSPTAAAHTIVILATQSLVVCSSVGLPDSVGVPGMARFSLEEGRKEIALLLEAGEKEFDNGNPLVALSILFEAQGALSEILQSEMEKVEGSASTVATSRCCADLCTINISSKLLH